MLLRVHWSFEINISYTKYIISYKKNKKTKKQQQQQQQRQQQQQQ